ncbi:cytochrome c-type biogenesis protein [Sedimenticola selenatireducens]|uniref:Cytochrome c-type biogenesis protein n=1 Tax=Sedimenticola selenatireducens TaxID=191960 RepID=A0A558DQC5_9GAMM|nr:cytochrome c-type biogenesis protein [Sedimenticola selenatireducens]TVO73016.1 cytochrome c-type biogenesis protein CcmH [Sedimenticola selenatireducens]TVT63224.1 MAG: cytochrome c-type biogenesis protein CcmH [Sedimenticola selenatireducens]
MFKSFLLIATLFLPAMSSASIEIIEFEEPAKEQLYMKLINELRCLVCQNNNLADSNAELAQDMRRKTLEMVKSGSTYDDVVNYMVRRYGDFVLFRPPFKNTTILLWIGPYLLLGGGITLMFLIILTQTKKKNNISDEVDYQRVRKLLTAHNESDNNVNLI